MAKINKPLITTIAVLALTSGALIGTGLGIGLPFTSDPLAKYQNTNSETSTSSISKEDVKLADHIFEFEEGEITGYSASSKQYHTHLCPKKSLYADPRLSGGLIVRNLSAKASDETHEENKPTVTFKFTSEKAVDNAILSMCIASKNKSDAWIDVNLGSAYSKITLNGKDLTFGTVVVPGAKSELSLGTYYNMQVIDVTKLSLVAGENTLVFHTAEGYLNTDYINIKTDSKIYGFTKHYLVANPQNDVVVTKAPTTSSTGTLELTCHFDGCSYNDSYSLPTLSIENGYKAVGDAMNPTSKFEATFYDKIFTFTATGE